MKKAVFITGGTTGIGYQLAKDYFKQGYKVGICGRDLSKISADERRLWSCYEGSVVDRDFMNNSLSDFAKNSKLEIVIANAGRSVGKKTSEIDFEIAREILNTNCQGFLNTVEIGIKLLDTAGGGHFVAMGSVAGMQGLPGTGPYCASKAYVNIFLESLAIDLKDKNIFVTNIAPGFVKTPLTDKNDHSMPWLMSTEKASKIIRKSIQDKKVLVVFPWQMKYLVAFLSKVPRWFYRLIIGLQKHVLRH